MAEQTGAGTRSSTPGATQSATNSTGSNTVVSRVRDQATAQLNTQKNKATDGLGSVAHAVRDTTERLRRENHGTAARYVEQAAEQIERFSTRLKDKDVGELMNDAQRLARRQPALFVGGAFAVGLLGARFLKSSSQDETSYTRNYGAPGRAELPPAGTANAYGNQVPSSASTATTASTADARSRQTSATSRGTDYKPTEGM